MEERADLVDVSVNSSWPDRTWNPIRGCSPVSEGCENCPGARLAAYLRDLPGAKVQIYQSLARWQRDGRAAWTGKLIVLPAMMKDPLRWRERQRIEVCSTSDLFHEQVPDEFIRDVFAVMMLADWHTFYVFTKRVERMAQWFGSWAASQMEEQAEEAGRGWPLPNVHLGFSAEGQRSLDARCGTFFAAPAARRLIRLQPLRGSVDLTTVECPVGNGMECPICEVRADTDELREPCADGHFNALYQGIDGVIVGCETGPTSLTRVMDPGWVADIRDQCEHHGTYFALRDGANISTMDGNG